MNPTAHNTEESSSSRSTETQSFHLGIWRKSAKEPFVTADTRCGEDRHQQKRCEDFLRLVKISIAGKIKSLLEKYAPEEWAERQK
jgi:hypothetical protein